MAKEPIPWQAFSETYAFLGNSLLAPMSQTADVGIDPEFWTAFPRFDSEGVTDAIACCRRFAEEASERADIDEARVIQDVSVEYTRLFIGPPSPAAAPWETMYRSNSNVGFGEATFQLRALLKNAGLELKNENHQYEDHMGIELLYLSDLCRRRATSDASGPLPDCSSDSNIFMFIETHPLSWAPAFHGKIAEQFPDGYYSGIVSLAIALLREHARLLTQ